MNCDYENKNEERLDVAAASALPSKNRTRLAESQEMEQRKALLRARLSVPDVKDFRLNAARHQCKPRLAKFNKETSSASLKKKVGIK